MIETIFSGEVLAAVINAAALVLIAATGLEASNLKKLKF